MYEIIFDNGGGTTLMTDDFCHHYDDPSQAAGNVMDLLEDFDTTDWDGNEPDSRVVFDSDTERNGGHRWLDNDDISMIRQAEELPENLANWGNAIGFFKAFGPVLP